MRNLTDHRTPGNQVNEQLVITATDELGMGGANHRYEIIGFNTETNASADDFSNKAVILFQNGPIKENGVNGITQEALLAIIIDRLKYFQLGNFACKENAVALTHIETALLWLQKRTIDRLNRGVEGTLVK